MGRRRTFQDEIPSFSEDIVMHDSASGKRLFFGVLCALLLGVALRAQNPTQAKTVMHATGPFDVDVVKQDDPGADSSVGRFRLDKKYHGDLEASGKGQMLTASTEVKGSGAYVAIERVEGTLKGKEGGFSLQHMGTMTQN